MKILYLDDDPEEIELLERTLELVDSEHLKSDTQVIGATSVEEADGMLANEKVDMLLVDYSLTAGRTSEPFIRRMIGNSTSPPVVLITAKTSLKLGEELLSAVADSNLYICHKRDLDPAGLSALMEDVMGTVFRILVVDDDENDFSIVTMHLSYHKELKCKCVWARSPSHARDILRDDEKGFDAFIVDYQMPTESGSPFVKELVSRKLTQPIIICSGYNALDMDTDLMRMIANRQVKFLSKNNLSTDNLVKRLQANARRPY